MSDAKAKIAAALGGGEEDWYQSQFLPIRTRKGEWDWGVPGMIQAPWDAWTREYDSAWGQGEGVTPDQQIEDALAIMPTPGAVGAAMVPKSALGMFGGRLAATADKAMLKQAEEMAAQGVPREEIWKATGWFQGVDGKWRFEINDRHSAVLDDPRVTLAGLHGKGVPIRERVIHGDYFRAYPEAADLKVQAAKSALRNGESSAMYYAPKPGQHGYIPYDGTAPDRGRSVVLHEMQHDAQYREGFSPGANSADPNYRRAAGEVEARAVQKRQNMTAAERRDRPPWLDYDVPEHQQIVRALLSKP